MNSNENTPKRGHNITKNEKDKLFKKDFTKTRGKNGWGGTRPGAGRPRRKSHRFFTKGDLKNAARILRFNAPIPPPCICGERDFYFYIDERGRLIARCRRDICMFKRYYTVNGGGWGPFYPELESSPPIIE